MGEKSKLRRNKNVFIMLYVNTSDIRSVVPHSKPTYLRELNVDKNVLWKMCSEKCFLKTDIIYLYDILQPLR